MLLVLIGGSPEDRRRLVRYLLDEHQFTGCSQLPRGSVSGRMVVDPDVLPTTPRARATLIRRTARMGGVPILLDDVAAPVIAMPLDFKTHVDTLVWALRITGLPAIPTRAPTKHARK